MAVSLLLQCILEFKNLLSCNYISHKDDISILEFLIEASSWNELMDISKLWFFWYLE